MTSTVAHIHSQPEAAAIIEEMKRHQTPAVLDIKDNDGSTRQVLVVGGQTVSTKRLLEEYRTRPERRKGTVTVHNQDSLELVEDCMRRLIRKSPLVRVALVSR